jgi:hypothetical protein
MKTRLASFALSSVIGLAATTPARAEAPAGAVRETQEEPTRQTRRWLIAGVAKGMAPMLGIDLSYHVTDRFALGAQLSSLLVWGDASAYARYFPWASADRGLFVDVGVHATYVIMNETMYGPSLELGYEGRSPTGGTASISAGVIALRNPGCHHCGPGVDANPHWIAVPSVTLRLGHAF